MNRIKIISGKIKRTSEVQTFMVEINGNNHVIDVSIVNGEIDRFDRMGYFKTEISNETWEDVEDLLTAFITQTVK